MIKKTSSSLAMNIAKQLTAKRLQNTWSRDQLAKRANINVYTLKHFERTGQISLERLISICQQLGLVNELERVFKPRERVNVDNWETPEKQSLRKRGKSIEDEVTNEVATEEA